MPKLKIIFKCDLDNHLDTTKGQETNIIQLKFFKVLWHKKWKNKVFIHSHMWHRASTHYWGLGGGSNVCWNLTCDGAYGFWYWKGHIEGICNLKPTTINVTRYILKNLCGLFYAPSQMVFKFYESGLMYMIIMQFSKVWSWYYLKTNDLQQM